MKELALALTLAVTLAGCGGESASGPGPASPGPAPEGPLANLDATPPQQETWSVEGGGPAPFYYYAPQNVRVNTGCKPPNGPLACDAIRYLQHGAPAQIPRRVLDGRMSAGARVCLHLGNALVGAQNSVGAEDAFCRFPDGSLVSAGALEQYKLHVIQ